MESSFSMPYSREYLKTYRQNLQAIRLVQSIINQVLRVAGKGETRLVYPWAITGLYSLGNGNHVKTDNIVNMLKEELPGVTVEYQEVQNIHGKVDSGIVIDWS